MKPRHPSLCGIVAALVLAGGMSAAQAQTAPPDTTTPPAGQAVPPSTQPSPSTPPTHPSTDPAGGAGQIDEDEARAIMAAREMCSKAADPQAQQDCMNQAQQDYYRAKSGGGAGGNAMPPGQDGSMSPRTPVPGSPDSTSPSPQR